MTNKYRVVVTETLFEVVEVEARDEGEAEDKVSEMVEDGTILLGEQGDGVEIGNAEIIQVIK